MRLLNLLKENNIIRISPDFTLSQALKKLSTSHDAAFVFDENKKFLGLINPYYTVIKNSLPVNAKITHYLFHPPKIKINYPLTKVVEFFILTKIHYLPVFDDKDNFIGIISARRVLNYLKSLPVFDIKVADFIKRKKIPIFIYPNTTVPEALATFKKTKVSKLIVVDSDGRLKGVLSYYDLIDFLVSPVVREERGERQGFKKHLLSKPVSDFYKSFVLTITKEDNLNKAINLILDKKIGSVIIVDQKRKPLNIITTSDLLRHYLNESKAGFFKNISSGLKSILPKR